MNNEKKFIKLTPFKMQILQTFPFIDADFDAITNYELLCKVVEYLNITVDNVNLLESDFKVLYDYVHDYFNNLDVQQEINNKLDEMAESGELVQYIINYLNIAGLLIFNNVEEMKNNNYLSKGMKCKTLGYYQPNDDGEANYEIVDTKPTGYYETLNNNLYAKLIINESINLECFGAYGNGINDDSQALQTAINNCKGKPIDIILRKKYAISQQINIDIPVILKGIYNDVSTILLTSENACLNLYNEVNSNNITYNMRWYNFKIDCNNIAKYGLKGKTSQSYFEKIFFINAVESSVQFDNGNINWFKDCYFYYNKNAIELLKENAIYFVNCNMWDNDKIIYGKGNNNTNSTINSIYFNNCWIEGFNEILSHNGKISLLRAYFNQTSIVAPIPTRRTINYLYKGDETPTGDYQIKICTNECVFTFSGSTQDDGIIILDHTTDAFIDMKTTHIIRSSSNLKYYINTNNLTLNNHLTQISSDVGSPSLIVSDKSKCVFIQGMAGYNGELLFNNGLVLGEDQPASPNARLYNGQMLYDDTYHNIKVWGNNKWNKIYNSEIFSNQLAYGQSVTTTENAITLSESINNFRFLLIQIRNGQTATNSMLVYATALKKIVSNGNKTTVDGTDTTIEISLTNETTLTCKSSGGTWYLDIYGIGRS